MRKQIYIVLTKSISIPASMSIWRPIGPVGPINIWGSYRAVMGTI